MTAGHASHERERIVVEHLGLVRFVAARFKYRGESPEDLQQIGTIGLIKAIDRFDETRGVKLSTFAIPYIAGEIHHHLRDRADVVRVPRAVQERAARTAAAESDLAAQLGRSPTIREIAERTGLSAEQVAEAQELGRSRYVQSLDQPVEVGTNDAPSLEATFGQADAQIETFGDRAELVQAMEVLDPREKIVVGLRFLSDLSQAQIAERLDCSQMQVSRLQKRALAKLRDRLTSGTA